MQNTLFKSKGKYFILNVSQMADIIFKTYCQYCKMARMDDQDIVLKDKIALRMKELRTATGKIQSEFASDVEKDRQTIQRWESGRGMSIYSINKFCKEIGIELWEFFRNRPFLNFPDKDSNKDLTKKKNN